MSTGAPDQERLTCSPCRGTGKVVSGLNGAEREVPCPWCGGDGTFHPGRDAQQGRAEG